MKMNVLLSIYNRDFNTFKKYINNGSPVHSSIAGLESNCYLIAAIKLKLYDFIDLLIANGALINGQCLKTAIVTNDVALVKYICENYNDTNNIIFATVPYYGIDILFIAAQYDNLDIIKYIISIVTPHTLSFILFKTIEKSKNKQILKYLIPLYKNKLSKNHPPRVLKYFEQYSAHKLLFMRVFMPLPEELWQYIANYI